MNIIVQTTGGYASSINVKSENPDRKLSNITRDLLLKSIHNKELWCFAYQYAIWLSHQTENRLCGDVPYFLLHGIITSYKHIKILGVGVYIINGNVTIKNIVYISHRGYLMGYSATTGVIFYWKRDKPFAIHIAHQVWFDEYNYCLSI